MTNQPAIHIDSDISRAWSLPAQFYTDPEIFAEEKQRVFARTWQVVGRREQLLKPGDFFTTNFWANRCCWCAALRASCGVSTMYAGIVLAHPQRDAVQASCFAAATMGGLTDSMDRSSVRLSLKGNQDSIQRNFRWLQCGLRNGSISSL